MKCMVCRFESEDLEEVCYYDINGWSHSDEHDIERHAQDPDALANILCTECAEEFNFE